MCKLTTTSVIKTPNQIEHVSTEGGIIHERTMFRGSEYLVWLVITQLIMQFPSFFYHIFSKKFGEWWWWCPCGN